MRPCAADAVKYVLRSPVLLVALLQVQVILWAPFVILFYPGLVGGVLAAFDDFWDWYAIKPPYPIEE